MCDLKDQPTSSRPCRRTDRYQLVVFEYASGLDAREPLDVCSQHLQRGVQTLNDTLVAGCGIEVSVLDVRPDGTDNQPGDIALDPNAAQIPVVSH